MITRSQFLYIDGPEERHTLISGIRTVRQQMLAWAASVPPQAHYTPRYDGLSLAALLAHLAFVDWVGLTLIQQAAYGVGVVWPPLMRLRPPRPLVGLAHAGLVRLWTRRLVQVTMVDIHRLEARIVPLVLTLPVDRFTVEVYHPALTAPLTAERALQVYFLHHWMRHLAGVQRVEAANPHPPSRSMGPSPPPSRTDR